MELFVHLECTPITMVTLNLFAAIFPGYMNYDLSELPVLIGLYGGEYMVVFRPGECCLCVMCSFEDACHG